MAFLGFVQLGSTLNGLLQTYTGSAQQPLDADALPRYQVYADGGTQVTAASGQAAYAHSGSVTNATNATPIVITSASHGLETGARVTISGVGGNTAANTTATITRVDANSFSLDGVAGNGAYTSGGSWHVSGLYSRSIAATQGNGFQSGHTYFLLSTWAISSSARAEVSSFCVM